MAKKKKTKGNKGEEKSIHKGIALVNGHPLFREILSGIMISDNNSMGKNNAAYVKSGGSIYLNEDVNLQPQEWAFVIAHNLLHLAFGHFDGENMPGYEPKEAGFYKCDVDKKLWNIACDIYITKFLLDVKFGKSSVPPIEAYYKGPLTDEKKIYTFLKDSGFSPDCHVFGTSSISSMDMVGLDSPLFYKDGNKNPYIVRFAYALSHSVKRAIKEVSGISGQYYKTENEATRAAKWFVDHYPLLGGLASGFAIVYDSSECNANDISIAAVDVTSATIYVNPASGLNQYELRFVVAHEYLHAGLQHYSRCQGRDRYLWNVACDFVINGWLKQMKIGDMPERGILYDAQFDNVSAEEVYDRIITDLRTYAKMDTLRGYGKGDVIGAPANKRSGLDVPMDLDEFYRSAIQNGLEYHLASGRGLIPAGLEQEIRALSMPPIPWDVKLAKWFEVHFPLQEKKRTYARPSRRQGSTPDIPRPRTVATEVPEHDRTFGVVIDTSGSMSAEMIGYALGAIASYSAEREVPYARVVFCDACAYDAGYISPNDIAGRVMVIGRGGTVLQPGIDCLSDAEDFPKDGPILIITDGMIESSLHIDRDHAYLLPSGKKLPFKAKGEVFYFKAHEKNHGFGDI